MCTTEQDTQTTEKTKKRCKKKQWNEAHFYVFVLYLCYFFRSSSWRFVVVVLFKFLFCFGWESINARTASNFTYSLLWDTRPVGYLLNRKVFFQIFFTEVNRQRNFGYFFFLTKKSTKFFSVRKRFSIFFSFESICLVSESKFKNHRVFSLVTSVHFWFN